MLIIAPTRVGSERSATSCPIANSVEEERDVCSSSGSLCANTVLSCFSVSSIRYQFLYIKRKRFRYCYSKVKLPLCQESSSPLGDEAERYVRAFVKKWKAKRLLLFYFGPLTGAYF